jgi:hypothetical protein
MLRNSGSERCFADDVAEATGLAPMFANGVIERCCRRAGVERRAMKASDLAALLPHIESSLLVYKTGREVLAALDRLKRLAAKPSSTKPTATSGRHEESAVRKRPRFATDHEPFALLRRVDAR